MTNDNNDEVDTAAVPSLPAAARLPINRCSLPAVILGGLTFQRHPVLLAIDGVAELYHDLFQRLDALAEADQRSRCFQDYMTVRFRFHAPEDAGLGDDMRHDRSKANYLRLLRGWMFDPDSRDGAVLKGWVESRFGLLPRHHKCLIEDTAGNDYLCYQQERQAGLYNTNALESQLDLLYSYCQYELARQYPGQTHWHLYRGYQPLPQYPKTGTNKPSQTRQTLLLNNINSFSTSRSHADTFGDLVMETDVPLAKIFFYSRLLTDRLMGEDEVIVLGGMYEVAVTRL